MKDQTNDDKGYIPIEYYLCVNTVFKFKVAISKFDYLNATEDQLKALAMKEFASLSEADRESIIAMQSYDIEATAGDPIDEQELMETFVPSIFVKNQLEKLYEDS